VLNGNFDDFPPFTFNGSPVDFCEGITSLVRGNKNVDRLAYHFVGASPGELLKGTVKPGDFILRVPDDDGSIGIVNQVVQVVTRLSEGFLYLFARGANGWYAIVPDNTIVHILEISKIGLHNDIPISCVSITRCGSDSPQNWQILASYLSV
jgi:hypothetical protein